MSEQPLVSIIIPAYNSREFLPATLESCLAQTYSPCEIIVVDDGSTDGTADMLRDRYGAHVRVLRQDNAGAGAARNRGIRAARGEFIQFCDSDDLLLPQKVEHCMAIFAWQPEVVLVYTGYDQVAEDGRTPIPTSHPLLPSGDIFCDLLSSNNFIGTLTVMVRRQAVLDVGGFNENRQVAPAEDWDLWLRLTAQYPATFCPDILALYRQRDEALHKNPLAMARARLEVISLARDYPERSRCLDDAAFDRLVAGRYHVFAAALWQMGRRREARRAFQQAVRLDPQNSTLRRIYSIACVVLPHSAARALEHGIGLIRRR